MGARDSRWNMTPAEDPVDWLEPGTDDADVLGSWKEVASYLERDVRTVMRWESARGLPVHRLPGKGRAPVFALKSELDAWRLAAEPAPDDAGVEDTAATANDAIEPDGPGATGTRRGPAWRRADLRSLVVVLLAAIGVAALFLLRPWERADGLGGARGATPQAIRPEVVALYMRGRYAYHSMTAEGLDSAIPLFRKALDLDPRFAQAWSGIALAMAARAFVGNSPPANVFPAARDAAQRALALDASQAEAVAVLGMVSLYRDRDFTGARRRLEAAARAMPDVAIVRHAYADYLRSRAGRSRASRSCVRSSGTTPRRGPRGSCCSTTRTWRDASTKWSRRRT